MGHQVLSVVSIPPCPPSPPLCLRSSIALMPDQSFCNIKCLTEFLYTTSQMLVYRFQLLKFKCYLQCAEQLASPSNLTKYCACHEKWHHKIVKKFSENCWSVIYNARPIREWSDNPSMKPSVRNPPRNRGYLSCSPPAFCIEKYNMSRSGYHSKFH